jgi:hypothetical protein
VATIDPLQEKQRLEELYASQTDEELENVAAQARELTDVAREALRAELTKRGLYVGQLEEIEGEPEEAQFRDLVTIRSFWYVAEAELARGLLESAGIPSFLFDENIVSLGWYANAVGGVRLRVDAANAEAANRILEEATAQPSPSEEPEPTS